MDDIESFSDTAFTLTQFHECFALPNDSVLSITDPRYALAPISDTYHGLNAKAGVIYTPRTNVTPKDVCDFPGDYYLNEYEQTFCHDKLFAYASNINEDEFAYFAVDSIDTEEPIKCEPASDAIDEAVRETLPLFDDFPVHLLVPQTSTTPEQIMRCPTLPFSPSQKLENRASFLALDWEGTDEYQMATNPKAEPKITAKPPKQMHRAKTCIVPNCTRCKAYGGGSRCRFQEIHGTKCTRSSQGGGLCRSHGGGKRCEILGCHRGQQRKGLCYIHGGIRQCQVPTCVKKDRGNGFCISHGGGKRCQSQFGCVRAVRRGGFCQSHSKELLVVKN
uniref:Uncharacterized protein AlNc14C55G4210 n=1 Tax=Albugo laibachii Nc14 TaxID=890382 RepID=F0WC24_9STRA|nr:conserved hypothetical protein [Albugo laibachii Nc14]|eukprot:CCA18705.1 conserved hypothetical protein [Albugo laibachii Nc14]